MITSMILISAWALNNGWNFQDVTVDAGLDLSHGFVGGPSTEQRAIACGVAAGDIDNDGWVDLYVVVGDIGSHHLFHNQGDGTFSDISAGSGLEFNGLAVVGPTFGDLDGDGWLDIVTGGINGEKPLVLRNRGDMTFEDVTASSGISVTGDSFSVAFGDYDRDGRLDIALSHWGSAFNDGHVWHNDGNFQFTDVDAAVGVTIPTQDHTFSPIFTDFTGDGWPDLLISADFGDSYVFVNQGDGTFIDATTAVISDENGMGAAVGDFDNDGQMDWFVSSIWDPDGIANGNWGITGNRLYHNIGGGQFEDVTQATNVGHGYWGWGSGLNDYNNDGWLDIFHVNGFVGALASEFHMDPARLFVSQGGSGFVEMAAALGVADTGQGRGVVSFDYDRDGDLDIFIHNNSGPTRLYRNDGGNQGNWIGFRLLDNGTNRNGIGARITLEANGLTLTREIRAGSNFVSQDPSEAHFGLGTAQTAANIRVQWPDGETDELGTIRANQWMSLNRGQPNATVPTLGGGLRFLFAVTILSLGLAAGLRIRRRRV